MVMLPLVGRSNPRIIWTVDADPVAETDELAV